VRFTLLDRIDDVQPGQSLRAVKNLTMAEEYLAEHFPGFPVLPGVLMLEAAAQAGSWLIRLTEGYRHSVVLLAEAKAVKYGRFVVPGQQLAVAVEWAGAAGDTVTMKVRGEVDGHSSIQARIVLRRFNLADEHPVAAGQDRRLVEGQKLMFERLASPALRTRLAGAA
jgi:3-hydroxyacyl-[acyl-carrier-protein] dehydratase